MPLIYIETVIKAPLARVFDLARSIDLHSVSAAHTRERAVAGRTSGLIGLHETVTWEAVHFGIRQRLESEITALQYPYYFRDEMRKGAFRSIYHEHIFGEKDGHTLMTDRFSFEAPLGVLGRCANALFLTRYMKRFLVRRNNIIKVYAETEQWQQILK
ncbi:MAG: cell division protein [Bacteroidetes bacterium 47-18]|nr:MAG: cell division protein [Bacteroidetes bacterium 47-18]